MKNNAIHLMLEGLTQVQQLLEILPELNHEARIEGTPEFDPAPLMDCQTKLISALDSLGDGETLDETWDEVSKAIRACFNYVIKFQDWADDREERISNAPLN